MTFPRSLALAGLMVLAFSLVYVPIYLPQVQAQSDSVVTDLNLTFTTIDVPGAGFNIVAGINGLGDMVGYYGTDSNANKHGFLYRSGIFTFIDYPAAESTFAQGINDSDLIAGSAEFQGGLTGTGFTYDGNAFTKIQTRKSLTFLWSINNAGETVGSAGVSGANFSGFAYRDGRFQILTFPGQYQIANPTGINNHGQIAGYTVNGSDTSAYVYTSGHFKNLNFPGALYTQAQGINDNGVVVGSYFVSPNLYGFAYYKGRYVSLGYPGAIATGATAINGSGQIVGQYLLPDLSWHGFVTNPMTAGTFK